MSEQQIPFKLFSTTGEHAHYAQACADLIEQASQEPGAALARRSPQYLKEKIEQGKAVIALGPDGSVVGFCYLEAWQDASYIANSGLVVAPEHRGHGLALKIKQRIFELSRAMFPEATMFGLTTSKAVMKINSALGYIPTDFAELTTEDQFWAGCQTCPHHHILQSLQRKNCLCTAMVCLPKK